MPSLIGIIMPMRKKKNKANSFEIEGGQIK
jgi:hypothetical protein